MGTDRRSRRSDRHDRGDRRGKESKRGRSKENKKSRSRDRRSRRGEERGDSDSSRKPVLVPAHFPTVPPPPPPARPPPGEEPDDDDEEGEEESEVAEDPPVAAPAPTTVIDVENGTVAKAAPPGPGIVPGPAKAETGSEAVAHREDDQLPHQGDGRDSDQGHKPGEKSSHQAKPKGNSDKSGRYQCSICGRSVGGGVADSWQHRRSGYHLGAYIYWNNQEKLPWKHCLDEGQRWSRHIWATGESGPEDDALPHKPVKKKETPVPVRCDPERSRRDKDQGGPDPDTGAGSARSNLLLQMWQSTLKELM